MADTQQDARSMTGHRTPRVDGPLKVSGAFHSPLMAPAVDGLREALGAASFADPVRAAEIVCRSTALTCAIIPIW